MQASHMDIFYYAAHHVKCWIALRSPNPLYERWFGRPGYIPKHLDCKAKTADNPVHPFGGLVIDPTKCPEAFTRESLRAAIETWHNKFMPGGIMPINFTCIEEGYQRGLVKHKGLFVFPDFDLMLINRSNDNGTFLSTSNKEERNLFNIVKPILNRGLGINMIQHGTEFMYRKGVGAREHELILWFGPGHKFKIYHSYMPMGGF